MKTLIEFVSVGKNYRTTSKGSVAALKDVNLEVGDGEFVCIVGPSGCGKSTLLKMVAGLIPVSEGRLILEGKEISGPSDEVGMVFQSPVLLPWRNVLENVLLPVQIKKRDRAQYIERAREILTLMGLKDFANNYPFELSGGMQQRAAIARALITDPSILLMDEPFGALDALTRNQLILELYRVWRTHQSTVLFVTHDLREAFFLANRVVVMSARPGTIIEVIDVPFGKDRDLELTGTRDFHELVKRGHHLLALDSHDAGGVA